MNVPLRGLLASRRLAVQRGELRRMWPGAAWDARRGIYWPIRDRLRPPLTPAQAHPDCPLCNPPTPDAREGHR